MRSVSSPNLNLNHSSNMKSIIAFNRLLEREEMSCTKSPPDHIKTRPPENPSSNVSGNHVLTTQSVNTKINTPSPPPPHTHTYTRTHTHTHTHTHHTHTHTHTHSLTRSLTHTHTHTPPTPTSTPARFASMLLQLYRYAFH